MVGLAETTHRDRHEGEVPEAAPAKHPLPTSPSTESKKKDKAQGTSLDALLSPSRQRLFRLLQRQLLLQLAAEARGGDVDPRRRPPRAATPHSILARWLAADPARLRGSCFLSGLHGRLLEGRAPTTHPSQRVEGALSSGGSPPPFGPSAAAHQQHKGTALKEQFFQDCREAAAAAFPAAGAPQREEGVLSSREGDCSAERGGGRSAAARDAQQAEASLGQEVEALLETSISGKLAVGVDAARGSRVGLCVFCCSPLEPSWSGSLCTPCLLRLGSSGTFSASSRAAGKASTALKAALPGAPQDKPAAAKEEQGLSRSLHSETHLIAPQRMAKRRCFRRAAPAAQQAQQAQQQQQQQPLQQEQQPVQQEPQQAAATSNTTAFKGKEGPQEDAGWRARATAAAAATEEESSWWRVPEASGESAVIPSLLLPLLPSIFALHARPWPPPPAKRRRIVSRRSRGLCMGPWLTEGPSWEDVVRSDRGGDGLLHLAPPEGKQQAALGQQRDDVAAAAATAAPAATESAEAAEAASVAARGSDIASAAAGAAAREGSGEKRLAAAATVAPPPDRGGKQAADALKEERGACCCSPSSSTSCLGPSFECRATALVKGKEGMGSPCPACCCLASTDAKAKGQSRLCCTGSTSPLSCAQETLLPRRRRGRLRDPAGTSAAAAVAATAAAAGSRTAAGRDIAAAAAAAAANFKTDGQQHEQRTPFSRFRRRSCGAGIKRHSAAAAAGAAPTAAAAAEAAKGEPAVSLSSEGSPGSPPAPAVPERVPARAAAGAAAAAAAGATTAGAAEEIERTSEVEGACLASTVSGVSARTVPLPPPPFSSPLSVGRGTASSPTSGRHGGTPGGGGLARISQGLMVGPSSLGRGSGLGIYSCRSFSRRAVVCEYSGVLIDRGTALLLRRMRCASHVINVQMQHLYLLGFHTPSPLLGGGAFVNDGRWRSGGREGPGVSVRFRVRFDRHRAAQRVMVVAARDIEKGEELLTSYDNDYWRLMAQQGPPYAPPTHRGRRWGGEGRGLLAKGLVVMGGEAESSRPKQARERGESPQPASASKAQTQKEEAIVFLAHDRRRGGKRERGDRDGETE
ncbi:hypothetical protein Esti_002458 [Eimeria stiedai]